MSNRTRTFLMLGLALTVIGSLLPWSLQGDFIPYSMSGIQLFPIIKDNGGGLVILLSATMLVLEFLQAPQLKSTIRWSVGIGLALLLTSGFNLFRISVNRWDQGAIVGAPTIQVGLFMVLAGSIILLITASFRCLHAD